MFLSDDFLLKDDWAKKLYHSYAKNMPIIDYHCHLDQRNLRKQQFQQSDRSLVRRRSLQMALDASLRRA